MNIPAWTITIAWTALAAAVGFAVGLGIDLTLVSRLRDIATRNDWHFQAALARSLRGMPEVWCALLAVTFVHRTVVIPNFWLVWLPRAWKIALILSVTIFIARLATAAIRTYVTPAEAKGRSGSIFLNLTKTAIWAVGVTFTLGAFDVQIGPIVAALGVTGIAISLGLQDTLANLFNGLQITLTRQLEPGHYVKLQSGEEGEVVDVNWRDTSLRTGSGDVVIVPNSVVGRTALTNFTRGGEPHITGIEWPVPPGMDLDAAVALGVTVAKQVQSTCSEAVSDFEPTCRIASVTADGATCTTRLQVVSFPRRGLVTDAYLRAISKELAASASA